MNFDYKELIGRIASNDYVRGALLLFLLQMFMFYPVYLENKVFLSSDAVSASNATAPLHKIYEDTGEYPFWQPYIFSGMPAYSSLTFTKFVYAPNLLLPLLGFLFPTKMFSLLFHLFLAGFFTFLFLKRKGVNQTASLFGGVIFMMNPYLVTMFVFGHGSQSASAAYIPLVLLVISELWDNPTFFKAALTATVLGFQLQRAHIQIVYYTWMLIGFFLLFALVSDLKAKERTALILRKLSMAFGGMIVAFGLAAVLYIPVKLYSEWSIRGGGGGGTGIDYATQWSFSLGEMMTFLVPSFYGFGGRTYWGDMPFTDYPNYMGIIALALALYAFVRIRKRLVHFLIFVSIGSLLISFGRHFSLLYSLLYDYLPFFNKFRVPAMILILLQFSVAVAAGYGLSKLVEDTQQKTGKKSKKKKPDRRERYFLYGLLSTVAVLLLVTLATGQIETWFQTIQRAPGRISLQQLNSLNSERFDLFIKDFWIVMLILLGFITASYFRIRSGLSAVSLGVITLGLTAIDLGIVDKKIMKSISLQPASVLETVAVQPELVKLLKQEEEPFRIFPAMNLFGEKYFAAHGIESIGGYHPAKFSIYQSFLEKMPFGKSFVRKYYKSDAKGGAVPRAAFELNRPLLDSYLRILAMLNVRYVISPFPIPETSFLQRGEFSQTGSGVGVPVIVYEHTGALPRAWLVNKMKVVLSEREVLDYLMSPLFDPANEVVVSWEDISLEPDAEGSLSFNRRSNSELEISVETTGKMLLVMSEVYYPAGWHAYLDGEKVETLRTNYVLSSVVVPGGKHVLKMKYSPPGFGVGLILTVLSYGIVLTVFLVHGSKRFRRKRIQD